MGSILEKSNQDKERAARSSARLERMRREKQRQMRRRRMWKKYFRLGVGLVGLILVMITSVAALGKKEEVSKNQQQTEMVKQPEAVQPLEKEEGQAGAAEGVAINEERPLGSEAEMQVYSFETTSATGTIDSEEIISDYAILVDESKDTIIASKRAREYPRPP